MFVRLAARPGLRPADGAVAEVVRLCGYLPLAIRLVGAGIRHHPAWTVSDLAAELATVRDRLAAMRAEDVSVAAAFDLSYQDLTAGLQCLFRLAGLHPGADISAGCWTTTCTPPRPPASTSHGRPPSPASLRRRAPRRPGPQNCAQEEAIAWLGTERPNLRACADYAAAHGHLVHAVRIPIAMNDFLQFQGHWNEAVTLGEAALAAAGTVGDRQGKAGPAIS